MFDIMVTLWIAAVLILISGFFLGFMLGRVKGQNDCIESKKMAEEYIQEVIEGTREK